MFFPYINLNEKIIIVGQEIITRNSSFFKLFVLWSSSRLYHLAIRMYDVKMGYKGFCHLSLIHMSESPWDDVFPHVNCRVSWSLYKDPSVFVISVQVNYIYQFVHVTYNTGCCRTGGREHQYFLLLCNQEIFRTIIPVLAHCKASCLGWTQTMHLYIVFVKNMILIKPRNIW